MKINIPTFKPNNKFEHLRLGEVFSFEISRGDLRDISYGMVINNAEFNAVNLLTGAMMHLGDEVPVYLYKNAVLDLGE